MHAPLNQAVHYSVLCFLNLCMYVITYVLYVHVYMYKRSRKLISVLCAPWLELNCIRVNKSSKMNDTDVTLMTRVWVNVDIIIFAILQTVHCIAWTSRFTFVLVLLCRHSIPMMTSGIVPASLQSISQKVCCCILYFLCDGLC